MCDIGVWHVTFLEKLESKSPFNKNNRQGVIICAMVKSRYIGDGHPTFNDGILIMGI